MPQIELQCQISRPTHGHSALAQGEAEPFRKRLFYRVVGHGRILQKPGSEAINHPADVVTVQLISRWKV